MHKALVLITSTIKLKTCVNFKESSGVGDKQEQSIMTQCMQISYIKPNTLYMLAITFEQI